jgi:hypothetical protein
MASRQLASAREEARTAFARVLLQHIRQDTYPSTTHMDILEQSLPAPLYEEYLDVLLEKVLRDTHPSIPLMRRIVRLTAVG